MWQSKFIENFEKKCCKKESRLHVNVQPVEKKLPVKLVTNPFHKRVNSSTKQATFISFFITPLQRMCSCSYLEPAIICPPWPSFIASENRQLTPSRREQIKPIPLAYHAHSIQKHYSCKRQSERERTICFPARDFIAPRKWVEKTTAQSSNTLMCVVRDTAEKWTL